MAEAVQSVGFIGLGKIGKPMALRLAESRFELIVFDVAPQPLEELIAAGARAASSIAELAASCDLVCVMVRDDAQVRDVLGQLLGTAREQLMVAIHSTVSPHSPAELADIAARHDVIVFDAPVSGGAAGAASGDLAILVGADEGTFTRSREVLEVLGSKVVHAGPVGAGTQFKLARNMLTFTGFAAASESLRLAEAAGLDLRVLGDVVRHTDAISGGAGAIMHRETTASLGPDDFWYAIFENVASLGEKDLRFAVELADDLQVDVPLARLALDHLSQGLGLPKGD